MNRENAMESFCMHLPVRVHFGAGQLGAIGKLVSEVGGRVCLLTMPDLMTLGMVGPVVDCMREAGLTVEVCDCVKPEPICTDIDSLASQAQGFSPDVLVAFGGGSVIDVAKALSIRLTHSSPIWMYANLSNRPPYPIEHDTVPVVAIPTTAGTGSEVTPYSVLSNEETRQKGTIKSPALLPRLAVVDPEVTFKMPAPLTAATGIDAFAHALESYINVSSRTPFSDMVAEQAISQIYSALPGAVENGQDGALREHMAWGSLLGGLAIANAGTTVIHALAQPLGAHSHLPHSLAVSAFMLPVLRRTWASDVDRFSRLGRCLVPVEMVGLSARGQAEKAVEIIERFLVRLGFGKKVSKAKMPSEVTDLLVQDVMGYMSRPLKQHPVVFSEADIRAIAEDAIES